MFGVNKTRLLSILLVSTLLFSGCTNPLGPPEPTSSLTVDLDQINVGSSILDTRELPDEQRDCCEEVKLLYKKEIGNRILKRFRGRMDTPFFELDMDNEEDCIKAYDEANPNGLANHSCEKFKDELYRVYSPDFMKLTKYLIDFWEECENA